MPLLRRVYSRRRNILLDQDISAGAPSFTARIPVLFRPGERADLDAIAADRHHEVSASTARLHRRLLAQGHCLMVGVLGDRVIYRAWASLSTWRVAGSRTLPIGGGKAIIYRCHTVSDCRRQGVYAAALSSQMSILRARHQVRRAFINVEESNSASLAAIQKVGFSRCGEYEVVWRAGVPSVIMEPSLAQRVGLPEPAKEPARS